MVSAWATNIHTRSFVILIAGGLAANTNDMAFAKVLRNTNLANLIVWSYWWPLIILSAVFFGRVWCMVCPMELLTSLAAKVGLRRKPPDFFRSGWIITGFYILILFIGIHTLAIHRVPFRMAIYMILLLSSAVVAGLLFSRNTFCRQRPQEDFQEGRIENPKGNSILGR